MQSLEGIDSLVETLVDMTDDQWFSVLDVTLNSVFRMTRAILPHMIERRGGVIVNNASVLGWRAQKGQDIEGSSMLEHGVLSVPSVYAIDKDGTIAFAFVEPNYKVRLPTDELMQVARDLAASE